MADNFDKSLGSISVSISKGSVYESGGLSMFDAALEDALRREEKSISNESIQKGDTLLETYTVEANAISGGMGSVWRVHHQSWNTDLAMKRPQPRFFAEGSKKRKENFIKECEAWINLGLHPNIVSCYYVREIGGVPTIFSEWMNNGSLKDRIRDGSLYIGTEVEQEERLLDLAIQFARGLRYSHENGLIHRDVKPDNLLLTKDWDAKVADFGLAKARDEAISEDGTAHKGGYTPEYCSGEQAAELYTDARTDVYSWALTVLEMYTKGRVWESGPTVSKNREQFINAVKLPLPEGLRGLLYRCFEADADKHPGDFAEIEATLREIYKSETDGEYPRSEPKAAADTADSINNRALSMLDLGKPEEAEKLWERALTQDIGHPEAVYNYALYRWVSGITDDWAAVQAVLALSDNEQKTRLVERLAMLRQEDPEAWRNAEGQDLIHGTEDKFFVPGALYNKNFFELSDIAVFNHCDDTTFLVGGDYAGDGKWNYRFTRRLRDGGLSLWIYMPAGFSRITVSADGKWLCCHASTKTYLYDLDKRSFGEPIADGERPVWSACAAQNGKGFYQGCRDGLYYYDIQTKTARRLFESELPCRYLTPSPDGRFIAWQRAAENGHLLQVFDLVHNALAFSTVRRGEFRRSLCFSSDGANLYVGDGEEKGRFTAFDAASGEVLMNFETGENIASVCTGKDGRYALTGHSAGRIRVWDVSSKTCLCTLQSLKEPQVYFCRGVKGDARIGALCNGGRCIELPFPEALAQPAWEISAIAGTGERLLREERFMSAILAAEAALAAGDYALSLERLKKARAVPGHQSKLRCLALLMKLAPHFRRGRLLGVVLLRHIPQIAGACLSKDGRFILDYHTNAVWSVQSGDEVISEHAASKYKDAALIGGNRVAYCDKQGEKQELMVDIYRLPDGERTDSELAYSGRVCHENGISGVALNLVASSDCESFVVSFPGFSRNRYVAVNGSGEILGVYPPPSGVWAVAGTKDILPDTVAFIDAKGVVRLENGKRLIKWNKIPDIQGRVFKLMSFGVTANEKEKLAALISMNHSLFRKKKLKPLVDEQNNRLFLFSLETGELLRSVRLPKGKYATHHGGYLTCVQDGDVLFYNIAAFRESENPAPIRVPIVTEEISFSADMQHMFASSSVYFLDWELL